MNPNRKMTLTEQRAADQRRTLNLFMGGGAVMIMLSTFRLLNEVRDEYLLLLCIGLVFWICGLTFRLHCAPAGPGLRLLRLAFIAGLVITGILLML